MLKFRALSLSDMEKLKRWIAASGTPPQIATRCRIVLAAVRGKPDATIARELSVERQTVRRWRKRFIEDGLDALWYMAPGRGPRPVYDDRMAAAIVSALVRTLGGRESWSCRTLAQRLRRPSHLTDTGSCLYRGKGRSGKHPVFRMG